MPRCEVRDLIDAYAARRLVRDMARAAGFDRAGTQELEIVVSELASNIVKYGTSGSLDITTIDDPGFGPGLAIVAEDRGPPFHDLELALKDGYDDRGPIDPLLLMKRRGLGAGLGAVLRLTDAFLVEQDAAQEKRIRVRRYLRRPKKARRSP
jgi:anti-sigma regulatory factor (Ser/Thr protein kinase)